MAFQLIFMRKKKLLYDKEEFIFLLIIYLNNVERKAGGNYNVDDVDVHFLVGAVSRESNVNMKYQIKL